MSHEAIYIYISTSASNDQISEIIMMKTSGLGEQG